MSYEEWGGRKLVSDTPYDDRKATEYGGVDGLIQPAPHQSDLDSRGSREQLMKIYNTRPGGEYAGQGNDTVPYGEDDVPETALIQP
jgi:hypothetical protein